MLALILVVAKPSLAQFNYGSKLVGLMMKTGISYSAQEPIPSSHLALGWGFYRYLSINPKNDLIIPFHFLKVEINGGARSGLFAVNNLNQTVLVRSRYLEVALIAPLTWELSDHIAANIGAGASLVWVGGQTMSSNIVPAPLFEERRSLKGGFMFDYHILFAGKSNAVLGSRILRETSNSGHVEWSLYFGFGLSPKNLKERFKKT
jgi:hypothetical protein